MIAHIFHKFSYADKSESWCSFIDFLWFVETLSDFLTVPNMREEIAFLNIRSYTSFAMIFQFEYQNITRIYINKILATRISLCFSFQPKPILLIFYELWKKKNKFSQTWTPLSITMLFRLNRTVANIFQTLRRPSLKNCCWNTGLIYWQKVRNACCTCLTIFEPFVESYQFLGTKIIFALLFRKKRIVKNIN